MYVVFSRFSIVSLKYNEYLQCTVEQYENLKLTLRTQVQRVKPKKITTKKKEYSPFPPKNHIMPSKLDKEIESGEYFQNEIERKIAKKEAKREKAAEKKATRERIRMAEYVPPKIEKKVNKTTSESDASSLDIEKLKRKLKKKRKREEEASSANVASGGANAFLTEDAASLERKKKKKKKDKKKKKKEEEEIGVIQCPFIFILVCTY